MKNLSNDQIMNAASAAGVRFNEKTTEKFLNLLDVARTSIDKFEKMIIIRILLSRGLSKRSVTEALFQFDPANPSVFELLTDADITNAMIAREYLGDEPKSAAHTANKLMGNPKYLNEFYTETEFDELVKRYPRIAPHKNVLTKSTTQAKAMKFTPAKNEFNATIAPTEKKKAGRKPGAGGRPKSNPVAAAASGQEKRKAGRPARANVPAVEVIADIAAV